MRRPHLRMHCQRIEINLGALAWLSLMAIVVLTSRRKGEVAARLRIAASDIEPGVWSAQDPCELARSNMIETEGLV
jgi:hypothetical protein